MYKRIYNLTNEQPKPIQRLPRSNSGVWPSRTITRLWWVDGNAASCCMDEMREMMISIVTFIGNLFLSPRCASDISTGISTALGHCLPTTVTIIARWRLQLFPLGHWWICQIVPKLLWTLQSWWISWSNPKRSESFCTRPPDFWFIPSQVVNWLLYHPAIRCDRLDGGFLTSDRLLLAKSKATILEVYRCANTRRRGASTWTWSRNASGGIFPGLEGTCLAEWRRKDIHLSRPEASWVPCITRSLHRDPSSRRRGERIGNFG